MGWHKSPHAREEVRSWRVASWVEAQTQNGRLCHGLEDAGEILETTALVLASCALAVD